MSKDIGNLAPSNPVTEILLVEDCAEDIELTIRVLRRGRINNPVHVVHDGRAAIDYLHGHSDHPAHQQAYPGLVLLDLDMPQVGGLDVVRHLKTDAVMARIPIIVLTSSIGHRDMIQSYNLDVNAYLIKPINLHAFMEVAVQVGMSWTMTAAPSNVR